MAQQASTNHNNKHVAAFAFPYGAHATPFLNLVVKLARAAPSAWFSFFTTPNSINNLSLFDIPPNLHFYDVVWDGISDDHPLRHSPQFSVVEMADLFLKAGPSNLQHALDFAMSNTNRRVTCVMADAFVTPSLVLSQSLQVPWIAFWASNAYSLTSFFHAHFIRHNCFTTHQYQTLSFIPGFSHFRIQDLPHNIGTDEESIISKALVSMGEVLPQAKAVVVNFYEELDPPSLVQHLRSKLHSFIYAGFLSLSLPLPPLPPSHSDITGCLSWLDKHPPLSVAYISLGTLVTPPPHELVAIAEALEETKVPFLWSLKDQLRASLPHGFVERSSMKGKIVPWAPQTMVLGHDSVGVFVTHGGNNSISESVSSSGVPMICRPYFGDHMINARMVEAVWEIGVKIEGGVFTKEGLIRSLKLILEHEEGKVMREKAQALKKIVLEAAGPKGKVTHQLETLVELVLS